MPIATKSKLAGALALSISLSLGACGGSTMENRSLYSVKQPVVERTNIALDVTTSPDGLSISEQRRLADWFDTMDLRYGDRVSIDDPLASQATYETVNKLAGRYGIIVSPGAPVMAGQVAPGQARVVITRSVASVPGCPDWSKKSETNLANATSPGFGCAVNGNLALMVANPEDLITGQKGTGETVVMSSTKAIETYREKPATGTKDLTETDTRKGK